MEALKKNHNKIITLKQAKKVIIFLVFVFFFEFLLFPAPVAASQMEESTEISQNQSIVSLENEIDQEIVADIMEFNGKLPQSEDAEIDFSKYVVITAYNSEVGQTDNSPCITANGFDVCKNGIEDTIAANFLPFGTKVKIPALFGDRVFVVRDRMNKRFSDRVDVWMLEKSTAIKFGAKVAKIEVIE
jgi:3D (Asp-Asp-Asp) domain-containing protein